MAKEPGSDQPAGSLKTEIEKSRERLARDVGGLRYELDIPAKIRRSFKQQPVVWVVAAVVVGAAVVALPRARKKVYVETGSSGKRRNPLLETGFLLGALRVAATLLKPTVASFIRSRMAGDGGSASRSSGKW
jgi:hypothetical protein